MNDKEQRMCVCKGTTRRPERGLWGKIEHKQKSGWKGQEDLDCVNPIGQVKIFIPLVLPTITIWNYCIFFKWQGKVNFWKNTYICIYIYIIYTNTYIYSCEYICVYIYIHMYIFLLFSFRVHLNNLIYLLKFSFTWLRWDLEPKSSDCRGHQIIQSVAGTDQVY